MKNNINKISYVLSGKYNFKLILILSLTLVMTFLELFSIALVIPLISSLIGSSDNFFLSEYLKDYFEFSGDKFVILSLVFFISIFIIKSFFLVFFNAVRIKFAYNLHLDLSNKLFKNYLFRDYASFIKQNSSKFIRNVSGECNIFSFGVVSCYIALISELIIVTSISIFLLYYSFFSSLFVITFIVILSGLILKLTHNKFKYWGDIRLKYTSKILQNLQESYGYIKEIIFSASQNYFLNRHFESNNHNNQASIKRDIYSSISRPILETITLIAFFILIILSLLFLDEKKEDVVVLIGVIFFASIKVLPSITQIIESIQSLKFNTASIDTLYDEFKFQNQNFKKKDTKKLKKNFSRLNLKNVNFSYDGDNKKLIFKNLNFEIKKNDKIGIMGKSGGGKTTFLNLISGLLTPTSGVIYIDKDPMRLVINQWKKNIGYVHQNVFLADDTILFNLTLKKNVSKIELNKVRRILKIVELDKHINTLEYGLFTDVGERGAKLSGGQSQRLGIARALFRDNQILILDEATSALDEETQKRILRSIYRNMKEKTIITVSHRVNTLKFCKKIYKLTDRSIKKIN